jgi:predicted transcriptional regulator
MDSMDLDDFGSLQLRVLEMLWERGQASAGELWQGWPEKPEPAYTTVLSALQKLHRRKLAQRRKRGRAHVYAPRIDRETFRRKYVSEVRRKVFGGSSTALAAALLGGEEVSDGEFQEIRKLLQERRKR